MPKAPIRPTALFLALAASLALAAPAGAQVYYPGPVPGPYVVPPRPGYVMLPPWEVRNIVRGMGYWRISQPQLSGRIYTVAAVDEEGPVVLRIDGFTGRVIAARNLTGGPPPYVPPPAVQAPRAAPKPPKVAARPPAAAPLPPPKPPELLEATAPAAPPVPAPPVAPSADATPDGAGGKPSAAAPASDQARPASAAAAALADGKTPDKTAADSPAPPAKGPAKGIGAGTATPGAAAAGTASVLSRPVATAQ